jgi:hypothetical protein
MVVEGECSEYQAMSAVEIEKQEEAKAVVITEVRKERIR